MRTLMIAFFMVFGLGATAQQVELDWENPIQRVDDKVYELTIDNSEEVIVKYTQLREDESVAQTGFYRNQKPCGIWKMYDLEGNVISTMLYKKGKRQKLTSMYLGEQVTVYYQNNRPMKRVTIAYIN